MSDVAKFNIDGTDILVKDQTARTSASAAVTTANAAMAKAEYIESLARIVVTYTAANETITFTTETHEEA